MLFRNKNLVFSHFKKFLYKAWYEIEIQKPATNIQNVLDYNGSRVVQRFSKSILHQVGLQLQNCLISLRKFDSKFFAFFLNFLENS
jgi:hypothetical protein